MRQLWLIATSSDTEVVRLEAVRHGRADRRLAAAAVRHVPRRARVALPRQPAPGAGVGRLFVRDRWLALRLGWEVGRERGAVTREVGNAG